MTDHEIRAILAGIYEHLRKIELISRETQLIALATLQTFAQLNPKAARDYEAAYTEHANATAANHRAIIEELDAAIQSLKQQG